jgi:hydroxymethylglutaryl-CoA synthase
MKEHKIGISDMQIYLPAPKIDLNTLVDERVREVPKLQRHLERACRTTGQRSIRFPSVWEDTSTLAASSSYRLIAANPDLDLSGLRYLTVGTESGVDHSKPVSAYVEGMLQKAGVEIPSSLSSFQVQHACAGGTLSLLSVSALLAASGRTDESGIVICSDVARYKTHTTAEITQGAGSVALLVESDPKLLELDLTTQGYCSKDVDDFFRPLGSKTAQVKGTYSMQCYRETLESALLDHAHRVGKSAKEVLEQTDLFALHAPFRNLPEMAMYGLLEKFLGLDEEGAKLFLEEKGLYDAIDVVADVGNIYTGAMYLTLAFQLYRQYAKLGEGIVGKKILLGSYGSGNIMTVLSATIAPDAPSVIDRWDLDALLESGHDASFLEYQQWIDGPYVPTGLNHPTDDESRMPLFTLDTIREDGYREYAYHDSAERQAEKSEAPVDLYQSA